MNQILQLKSSTKSICQLEAFIQCAAEQYNISAHKYPDILISLTEAVSNAIIHGNQENENKLVRVVMKKTLTGLVFMVHDEGNGFNPQDVPDPTTEELLDCCGGRGVFLMKQLADEVNYLNGGCCVRMSFAV